MYYTNSSKSIFFTHIPRTGGRFVDQRLRAAGFSRSFSGDELVFSRQMLHLDSERNEKYYGLIKDNSFTIVRHPVDRFISMSFIFKHLSIDINDLVDYNKFIYFMHDHPIEYVLSDFDFIFHTKGAINHVTNWLLPQVNFISSSTKIYKFEHGLSDNFTDWMAGHFGVSLPILERNTYKKSEYDKRVDVNSNIIDNVLRYYEKDLKIWESL